MRQVLRDCRHIPYVLPVCFCRCAEPFIASRAGPKQVRNTLSQAQDTKCTSEALGNTGDPILCRQLEYVCLCVCCSFASSFRAVNNYAFGLKVGSGIR